jgi:hypothetical protein
VIRNVNGTHLEKLGCYQYSSFLRNEYAGYRPKRHLETFVQAVKPYQSKTTKMAPCATRFDRDFYS